MLEVSCFLKLSYYLFIRINVLINKIIKTNNLLTDISQVMGRPLSIGQQNKGYKQNTRYII